MAIKVYLFDFDDTIISTKIYAQMYHPILIMIKKRFKWNDQQVEHKARELGLIKNKSSRYDTGDLCRELGLLVEYYGILEKNIKVVPALPNTIVNVFKKIKSKNKMIGIVSNSMNKTIALYLKKYKLFSYIDFIFSQDDAGCTKREEKYWKRLIQKEKLNPSECLMIGDDPIEDRKIPRRFKFMTLLITNQEDWANIL